MDDNIKIIKKKTQMLPKEENNRLRNYYSIAI